MIYHEEEGPVDSGYYITLSAAEYGRVTGIKINPKLKAKSKNDVYMNMMIINREFLINIIQDAVTRGLTSFGKDIISKNVDTLKIYGYKFEGYYAGIDSLQKYYQHSMELLDKNVRDELFGARDIYTKVRDSAPSKYADCAQVKNSLISDGCIIEGTGGKLHSLPRRKGRKGKRRSRFHHHAGYHDRRGGTARLRHHR